MSVPIRIEEKLLKLNEAATFLRFHPRTVLGFVKTGDLRARKIGGRWRFTLQDLRSFVAGPHPDVESGGEGEREK